MINKCRICHNSELDVILDLGVQELSCRFPLPEENVPSAPLVLVKCKDKDNKNCGLVQLLYNTPSDQLYEHTYGYRSGLNETMIKHLSDLSSECLSRISLSQNDIILDIGSNDCTLLDSYKNIPEKIVKVGIDPTALQFSEYYNGVKLIPEYFSEKVFSKEFGNRKAKLITSICMFYDLPDPLNFMKDIKSILDLNGIWVTEQSYIISMLRANSFDTICHEHLEYYAFKQIEYMANLVDLKIIDVSLNSSNGGSFRVTLTHKNNNSIQEYPSNVYALKLFESHFQLDTEIPYNKFVSDIEKVRKNLCKILLDAKRVGKNIYIYGASTKGGVLLQYFKIGSQIITAAAERNPEKYGRRIAGTNIPIVSEAEMRSSKPDMLVVLPWHFRDSFIEREQEYLNRGGQLIFPLPKFEIYTNKKKAFITGINGQIGHYLSELLLSKDYLVYGLLYKNIDQLNPNINYVFGDLEDNDLIKQLINTIIPNEIYNLGGETDTVSSFQNPEKTFDINAKIVISICETIKDIKRYTGKEIKLFQANSAELYKGNLDGEKLVVNEQSPFHPITPYSVSKMASYWTLKYYRKEYNLHVSNGIIFTTESSHRHSRYLSKKVINFIKDQDREILYLGNLNCSRDWIHASDVAEAIYLITQQSNSDDYIISSGISNTIRKFIELVFSKKNIELAWKEEGILEEGYDIRNSRTYIKIDSSLVRKFEKNEDLIGDNSKLKSIGWSPKYNLNNIIDEML